LACKSSWSCFLMYVMHTNACHVVGADGWIIEISELCVSPGLLKGNRNSVRITFLEICSLPNPVCYFVSFCFMFVKRTILSVRDLIFV
jgi:hypothetical protein